MEKLAQRLGQDSLENYGPAQVTYQHMLAANFLSIFRSNVPWPLQAMFFQTNSAGDDWTATLHWSLTT